MRLFVIYALLIGTILSSCLRLDSNFYAPDKLDEYKLDESTGYTEITVGDAYNIPDGLVNIIPLESQGVDETKSTTIYSVYIGDTNQISTDTVILYCHGNSYNMDVYWTRAKLLANTGSVNRFGVMMMDYRGYGMSDGITDEESLNIDVDACMQWLQSKGLSSDRLIIYGYSMGTAPSTALTATPRTLTPSKLILEAPFASTEVMAQDGAVLAVHSSFFTDLLMDNAEEIKNVSQPFLWIHGVDDAFLSMETHGEVVYKSHSGTDGVDKKAIRVEGADHNDVPFVYGYDNYLRDVLEFIEQ